MREKIWKDCPICGAKDTMRIGKDLAERLVPRTYPPVDISGLQGQFCELCGEGFWSLKSERTISKVLAEHMARHDSQRILAADLASVQEAAKAMRMTVQGVHKMMNEGRLRYVYAGNLRLPIRKDLVTKTDTGKASP